VTRILVLSSWVAQGHVGLSAAAPVLQRLGHAVTGLPTTILSNHPGWRHVAGSPVPPSQIGAMLEALDANGLLVDLEAILTGYLPSAEHAALAANMVRRLRERERPPRVIVDPILGDAHNGLYVPEPVATALRDQLLPVADVLCPNAFEAGWLCDAPVVTTEQAMAAARHLSGPGRTVLVTSAPVPGARIGVLSVGPDGTQLWTTPERTGVPHGTGDVFSALVAAGLSVGAALGHLSALIDTSTGAPHLRIVETAPTWTAAGPLDHVPFPEPEET